MNAQQVKAAASAVAKLERLIATKEMLTGKEYRGLPSSVWFGSPQQNLGYCLSFEIDRAEAERLLDERIKDARAAAKALGVEP